MNQDWLEVREAKAIRLLLSENAFKALAPFFDAPRSLSEAAAVLKWKLPRLSAWVRKLLGAKLLRVERVEYRAGSSIKRYRTSATAFYLPYEQVSAEVLDAFRERMNGQLEATLEWAVRREERAGMYGLQVKGDPFGGTMVSQVPALSGFADSSDVASPPVTNVWTDLLLFERDARAFNTHLNALLEEYWGRQGQGRYLVRLGFASLGE
jgi:hypothetical protein